MKEKLIVFFHGLILYDFILFGATGALFILLIILAVILRHRTAISITSIALGFIILILAPTLGYIKMHDYLFKNDIHVTQIKALEFTDALLIQGTLTNSSKRSFTTCAIKAGAYKISGNAFMDTFLPFAPFKKGSRTLDTIMEPNATQSFKLFLEPFHYSKEYNITIRASCR